MAKPKINFYCLQVTFCILLIWTVIISVLLQILFNQRPHPSGNLTHRQPFALLGQLLERLDSINPLLVDLAILESLAVSTSHNDITWSTFFTHQTSPLPTVSFGVFTDEAFWSCSYIFPLIADSFHCSHSSALKEISLQPIDEISQTKFSIDLIRLANVTIDGTDYVTVEGGLHYPSTLFSSLVATEREIDSVKVNVPSDLGSFIEQARITGQFTKCNASRAASFYSNFREQRTISEAVETAEFRRRVRFILKAASSALGSLDIPFWISSSVCLGWYRQCDVIPYSIDADIGMWAKDYRSDMITAMEDQGLQLRMLLGKPSEGYQVAFYAKDVKLDVYFFYPLVEEDGQEDTKPSHVWNAATRPETGERYRYIFPNFELCWTFFLDLKVRVPCDASDYIMANYGEHWFNPVTSWDWSGDPPNMRPWGRWPEDSLNDTVQVFG